MIPDLPTELVLRICVLSATSQAAYRNLELTCHVVRNLVREECLKDVPVVLQRREQVDAFLNFVTANPEVAGQIQYLWIMPADLSWRRSGAQAEIISKCTGLRSLACTTEVLLRLADVPFSLPHCTDLTLHGQNVVVSYDQPSWILRLGVPAQQRPDYWTKFFRQIQRLHLIGPFQSFLRFPFPNVTHLSYSCGQGKDRRTEQYLVILTRSFPKLHQVAVITMKKVSDDIVQGLRAIHDRMAATRNGQGVQVLMIHRPRRWTETKMWIDQVFDKDALWITKPVPPPVVVNRAIVQSA